MKTHPFEQSLDRLFSSCHQRFQDRPGRTILAWKLQGLALLVLLAGPASWAGPLGTQFWYSGFLNDNGNPANGNYDFKAALYDAASNGTQFGNTLTVASVSAVNGLVQFSLDFGSVFDGTQLWLDLQVKPSNGQNWTTLSPRMLLTATPYALYAPTAASANSVANDAVTATSIQNATITANKIATGQVVTSLNGLHDAVSLQAGSGISLTPNGNTLTIDSSGGGSGWSLTGNSGTTAGTDYLGTADNQPLELKVNHGRALRLEPASTFNDYSVNFVGGHSANTVDGGVLGGTIGGGGGFSFLTTSDLKNEVSANWGTIAGGNLNSVSGVGGTISGGDNNGVGADYGTIPGGTGNRANGVGSFAAGQLARVSHPGTFVWCDGTQTGNSSGPDRFEIFASGGMTLSSQRGLGVNSASSMITGGWDAFDVTAPPEKTGLGRWGLFMESPGIVLGMPGTDVGYKTIAFGRYHLDGTYDELMNIRNTDGRASFYGDFLVVNGNGSEQAYLGGDGIGNDVQLGSLNANTHNVAIYNATTGQYMDLFASTLTLFGGADLAEPFEVSSPEQEIPQGSVMIIDEENPGHLKMSERAYDTRVAGVLSGAGGISPGIKIKQTGVLEGSRNVALTGRVYVQAEADTGPIRPGDLLTTADTPGHAMKVLDPARAQGAVLGKAMTGLAKGRGLVLVLVTLQ